MEKGEISLYDIDSEKLHEHFSFKVDIGQNPLRIDKFLMLRIENATRNKINENFVKIFWFKKENIIKITIAKII